MVLVTLSGLRFEIEGNSGIKEEVDLLTVANCLAPSVVEFDCLFLQLQLPAWRFVLRLLGWLRCYYRASGLAAEN